MSTETTRDAETAEPGSVLIETAWGLIANAGWDASSGNVELPKTPGWHEAAIRWREDYHHWLDGAADRETADASLRNGAITLGRVVTVQARTFEAARIEMLQNGPEAAMQWILNSIPDVDDNDPEDRWNGTESASEWYWRTEAKSRELVDPA